jgi:dipeptidyl aminopeptidase/acylaminoacyl peptidase
MDSLRTKDSQVILAADSNVSFALGRLIFSRGGKLLEQLFDPSAGKPTGEPFTISADVWRNPGTGRSAFAVSPSGDVVYRNGTNFGATQLVIWDRKKKEVRSRLVNPTEDGYGNPVVSPDGKWIALDVQDYRNISMSALDKWDPLPVTSRQSNDSSPLWSWDSRQMLYLSNRDKPTVFRIDREDGKPEMIFQEDGILNIQDRSELHQSIIFEKADPQTKRDLWVYSEKEGKARQFLHGEHNEMHGQVSPDGKWIVYASDENDKYDIYIQKFPEGGPKKQISRGGGIQPKWNRNGNEVFYLAPDRGLMAVAIDSDTGAPKDKPTLLVKTAVNSPNALHARNNYSVLPDGEAFVINSVVDSGKPINVILNWKRR